MKLLHSYVQCCDKELKDKGVAQHLTSTLLGSHPILFQPTTMVSFNHDNYAVKVLINLKSEPCSQCYHGY